MRVRKRRRRFDTVALAGAIGALSAAVAAACGDGGHDDVSQRLPVPSTTPSSAPTTMADPTVTVPTAAASEDAGQLPAAPAPVPATAPRDPWLRPFRSDSIWNMPVGSGASYEPAGLPSPDVVGTDAVILMQLSAHDPARPLVTPASWTDRCGGTHGTGLELPIPDDYVLDGAERRDDGSWHTPNHVAALLMPDGRTVVNTNALARCARGGPVFGYQTGDPAIDRSDLYGDGRLGSHGGSRLSGLGGAIRPGDLTGDQAIDHALDLLVWAEHLHVDAAGVGYRWPAESADSYAADRYSGSNPELVMGSLLALAPDLSAESIGVRTDVGRRLFAALQDYGGYVTDDSAWDAVLVSVDQAAIGTFPWGEAEQDDVRRMVEHLSVVTNNGPDSIGGGGRPRRPLLPELIAPAG